MPVSGRCIRTVSVVMIAALALAVGVVPLKADDPEAVAEQLSLESHRGALEHGPGQRLSLGLRTSRS